MNRLRGVADGAAAPDRIERTFVAGESASNAAPSADTRYGAGGKAPKAHAAEAQPGAGQAGQIVAPPELANHPDYELIKELGQGGMGVVYLAKNRMMDRLEVLKVVGRALLDKPGAMERFQQEIHQPRGNQDTKALSESAEFRCDYGH